MNHQSMPAKVRLTDGLGATTVSRVLMSGGTAEPERDLLRKWAEHAAAKGGSFSIRQEWTENQWYTTYTIYWPAVVQPSA